jgi:hypothetical protein
MDASDNLETTQATTIGEPEPEEEQVVDERAQFMLLDRLFAFIKTTETPLNAVLAGYFTKLVSILI